MKHLMSMTCPSKIEAVFSGECTQTIRMGEKYCEGDHILIYVWTGKPYRSKWGRRMNVVVVSARTIFLHEDGYHADDGRSWCGWGSVIADFLARADGLSSGHVLRDTLKRLHRCYLHGQTAQVVRWKVIR